MFFTFAALALGQWLIQHQSRQKTTAGLQTILIPGNSDYMTILKYSDFNSLMVNIKDSVRMLAVFWDNGFWDNGFTHYLRYPTLVMTLVILWWAIKGMTHSVTKKMSPWFFFIIFYFVVVLAWHSTPLRFFLPIFPILLFFAFQYADQVDQRRKRLHQKSWLTLFLVVVALTYVGKYQKFPPHSVEPFAHSPFSPEAQAAFHYIRRNTPEGATFLFRRPRVLALLTGRKAGHSPSSQPPEVWQFAESIKADYLLVDQIYGVNMIAFVQAYGHKLRMIFKNNQFILYELITRLEALPDPVQSS